MQKPNDLSNVDIVSYVLAILGGTERSVFSEDIAARCYELAPARFSWRHEEYRKKGWPDKYITKTALEDAKKPEYGSLVEGGYALDLAKDGWRLTLAGVKWFQENSKRIASALNVRASSLPKKQAERFSRQVRGQPLFKKFLSTRAVEATSIYQFTDMLNCSPDAAPDVLRAKFQRLRALAELVEDGEISNFLGACAAAFPTLHLDSRPSVRERRHAP